MAIDSVNINLDLSDYLGVDYDPRRAKVRVVTNIESNTIVDTSDGSIRVGSGSVTLGDDGTATASVWIPGVDSNPASWQTSFLVDYPDKATNSRKTRTFGPYTITGLRTVTNKALTSNVATLTTAAPHGITVGDSVTVSDVDATFDGTYTVVATPTSTTFTYAKTASDVASVADTGTVFGAVVQLGALVVEQEVPAEYLTALTAQLQGYVDGAETEADRAATEANNAATEADRAEAAADDAVDISNIATPDALVEALALNTGGAGPLTSAALNAIIADQLDGLPFDFYYDNWDRSDRDLRGDTSPSGHVYGDQNDRAGSVTIVDGEMLSIPLEAVGVTPGQTSILMFRLSHDAKSVTETFGFRTDLGDQNRVCGFYPESFGNRSVQLASYASPASLNVHTGQTGLTWSLFSVEDPEGPGTAIYESIACNLTHGEYVDGFEQALETPYIHGMRRVGDSTVILTLIDGTTRTITDPRIATHGTGTGVGLQERHAAIDTGTTYGISVTASSQPVVEQPFPDSPMVFDGTPYNFLITGQPETTSDDFDVIFSVADWAPDAAHKIASVFETSGNRSWHIGSSSAGSLQMSFYVGATLTSVNTGGDEVPDGHTMARITRDATTGTIDFYTSTSDEARALPVSDDAWVLLRQRTNAVDGVPTGAFDASVAPLRLAHPTGAEGWFTGSLRYFALLDGIDGDIIAERDIIGTDLLGQTDSAGRTWQHVGNDWRWAPVTLVIPAAAAAVVTDYTAGANQAFVLDETMKSITLILQAAGGGGGSGRRGADGVDRAAGGGGAGGGHTEVTLDVAPLIANGVTTLYFDVGAKGTGGAAVTTDDTDGNSGTAGGATRAKTSSGTATSSNTIAAATGGNLGGGGLAAGTGAGGGASTGQFTGGAGRAAAASGGNGLSPAVSNSAPCGGASGGGISAGNSVRVGADGGPAPGWLGSVTATGGAAGVDGGDGVTPTYGPIYGTSGAGGGASRTAAAGRGGHGGSGAGGGSGGASKNGFNSGAGGDGGDGYLRVIAYY